MAAESAAESSLLRFNNIWRKTREDYISSIRREGLQSHNNIVLKEMGVRNVTIQIGNGTVLPFNNDIEDITIKYYRFKDSLKEDIQNADLVISHAGAGSCLEVLEAGKSLLVVINEELMNNHQEELAVQLHSDGHLFYTTCSELKKTIQHMDPKVLKPFQLGNSNLFATYCNSVFGFREEVNT